MTFLTTFQHCKFVTLRARGSRHARESNQSFRSQFRAAIGRGSARDGGGRLKPSGP